MGIAWPMCLIVYGMGVSRLGTYGAYTAYPMFLGAMILTGNLVGILRGEWRGTSAATRGYGRGNFRFDGGLRAPRPGQPLAGFVRPGRDVDRRTIDVNLFHTLATKLIALVTNACTPNYSGIRDGQ